MEGGASTGSATRRGSRGGGPWRKSWLTRSLSSRRSTPQPPPPLGCAVGPRAARPRPPRARFLVGRGERVVCGGVGPPVTVGQHGLPAVATVVGHGSLLLRHRPATRVPGRPDAPSAPTWVSFSTDQRPVLTGPRPNPQPQILPPAHDSTSVRTSLPSLIPNPRTGSCPRPNHHPDSGSLLSPSFEGRARSSFGPPKCYPQVRPFPRPQA